MTDFAKKLQTLPEHVQKAVLEKRGISYSRASTWHECPLRGKFKYIDELPDPSSEAMLHGSAFDTLTEDKMPDWSGISPENQAIIEVRAREYIDSIDKALNRQAQLSLYAELEGGYWFYGWADDLFISPGNLLLEDRKFSGKPWNKGRVKYNHKQAQCYIWALRQMGILVREMTFRVANLQQPGIQLFTYKPQAKSIAGIHDWLMEAVRMPTQVIMPNGGHHCGECPYKVACDDVNWPEQGLTNHES